MKSILGIVGALVCAALLTPSIADARGSGGGGRFSGHSGTRSYSDSDNSGGNALPSVPGDALAPELLPVGAARVGEIETDNGVRDDHAFFSNLAAEADVEPKGAEPVVDVGDADERAE